MPADPQQVHWFIRNLRHTKAAGDLGLGPTARVRLGLAQVQGQSLLESLTDGASFGSVPGQGDSQ